MDVLHFVNSLGDGYLECLHFGAIMNNATMHVHVQGLSGHISLSLLRVMSL